MPEPKPSHSLPQRDTRPAARPDAGVVLGGEHEPARSLYVHTPFCVHKCHYCDFYSFVDRRDQQEAFVARLERELAALAPHAGPLRTIFVGGGTPSLLRPALWERLLRVLRQQFAWSAADEADGWEFTVECNPESATPELMGVLKAGGVTRVSVGAQSFQPRHLRTLERWHDPANVERAIVAAREAGIRRQSVDLIYAIPGQTLAEWEEDLARAMALGTSHLSCYNLTYEPNTAMAARLARGEFAPIDEDLEADMFEAAAAAAGERGLARYEVSNYAAPGEACRHNLAYWRQEGWLAAGPAAAGHVRAGAGGHRWKNVPSLGVYLEQDSPSGLAPIQDHEPPDAARAVRERLMTGLRLAEGVPEGEMLARAEGAAPASAARLARLATEFAGDGLLATRGGRWTVVGRGWLMADYLARRMMAAVGEAAGAPAGPSGGTAARII